MHPCGVFQSTPPWEGATFFRDYRCQRGRVSIHAPVGGGDDSLGGRHRAASVFQSTPPWEGATPFLNPVKLLDLVSIHAPVGGGDAWLFNIANSMKL